MTIQHKPRYPVQVFSRLKRYPIRHCQNPECGRQLTPRYTLYQGKHHKLESVATFKTRKFCDMTCTGRARALKLPEERRARIRQDIAPLPPPSPSPAPVNWRDEVEPKICKECGEAFRPSPGVNTGIWKKQEYCSAKCRLAYNNRLARERAEEAARKMDESGSSAPEEVAEELEPVTEQVAEQAEQVAPDLDAWQPGELKTGDLFASKIPEARKPRIGQAVRPVKLPSKESFKTPPVPPPSLQAKLPDPRPQATPFTVTEGEVIERGDFGTCPNEGCGKRLNAFGRCGACEQRKHWLKGQRAKVGAA